VKRMIRILAVAVLVAVILVASMAPALARPRHHGHRVGPDNHPSCEATKNAQNERGAHHVVDPRDPNPPPGEPEQKDGCWVVLPSHQG
jgi:hypothetical protein